MAIPLSYHRSLVLWSYLLGPSSQSSSLLLFAIFEWFPTILREPLSASDTLSRRPSPLPDVVPASYGRRLETPILQGWWSQQRLGCNCHIFSSRPSCTCSTNPSIKPGKAHGPFRPGAGKSASSLVFQFHRCIVETVPKRFRAGRNLPDKEFRYLRTVIVTGCRLLGLSSNLGLLRFPLNLQHRQASAHTSPFRFVNLCLLNSCLGQFSAAWSFRHPFS